VVRADTNPTPSPSALRVAFVAAECEPWAKTGGLADVVDALARALGRIGGLAAPADVYLPRYADVPLEEGSVQGEVVLSVVDPLAAGGRREVRLLDVPAHGYRLRLVDCPPAYGRPGIYGDRWGDHPDNPWRFGLLARAALAGIATTRPPIHVLHLHDWHAAPVVLWRSATAHPGGWEVNQPPPPAVLLTIHNLAYHGWVPRPRVPQLGPEAEALVGPAGDGLDLLRLGIEGADLVTTVSPTFAEEARTPALGMGLDDVLRAKGDRFVGILNGLDTALWDPERDPVIAAPYRRGDLAGKARCREDLLQRIGFDPADPGPVLASISRLDPQKGIDILAQAAPELLRLGARLVVQGSGDRRLLDPLRPLAAAEPRRVALLEGFDREMARRIYAGADLFLMPSRFEPCGQGQMIALRYGTPPVVRRTGGLADTVVDETLHPGSGTGFLFDDPTPEALVTACRRALLVRGPTGSSARWRSLVDRGMAVDFSWERASAPRYLELYRRVVRERPGGSRG
jgi:starch synthase